MNHLEKSVRDKSTLLSYHHGSMPFTLESADDALPADSQGRNPRGKDERYGIEWVCQEEGNDIPSLIKTVVHVAFEVQDLEKKLAGKNVICRPGFSDPRLVVARMEVSSAPVELLQIDRSI